jgi:predicted DNA-binding ribbon-helix-helix protein
MVTLKDKLALLTRLRRAKIEAEANRLQNDQHQRLKSIAQARGLSLNKLLEQLSAQG